MNGLHLVRTSTRRRAQCLPICPSGTSGRILSRRLQHSIARILPPAFPSSTSLPTSLPWPYPPALPPSTSLPPTPPVTESPPSLPIRDKESIAIPRHDYLRPYKYPSLSDAEPIEGTLDPRITGLHVTAFKPVNPFIAALRIAVLNKQDGDEIWKWYLVCVKLGLRKKLDAGDYSRLLLSLSHRNHLKPGNRAYLTPDGKAEWVHYKEAVKILKERLAQVSKDMSSAGHDLRRSEYYHLIKCAAAMKDAKMAQYHWDRMTGWGKLSPDTYTYNEYMAATCGTASFERRRKVSEYTVKARSRARLNLFNRAMDISAKMARRGIQPNSMTYGLLILAAARMGMVQRVESLLLSVWDVDVNNLTQTPPTLASNSPLYPCENSLIAVTHAFGINGKIETAVQVVDYMSRRFDIPINQATWYQLLNWAYVWSRYGKNYRTLSNLSHSTVEDLFRICLRPPYSANPTIEMYDYLIRAMLSKSKFLKSEKIISKFVLRMYWERVENVQKLKQRHEKNPSKRNEKALALEMILEHRERSFIRRWVELLLLGKQNYEKKSQYWRVQPEWRKKYDHFLGPRVVSNVDGGVAVLVDASKEEWEMDEVRWRQNPETMLPLMTGSKEEDIF